MVIVALYMVLELLAVIVVAMWIWKQFLCGGVGECVDSGGGGDGGIGSW